MPFNSSISSSLKAFGGISSRKRSIVRIEYLIIAGGGSASYGGGGAGGFLTGSNYDLSPGTWTVQVGAGGSAPSNGTNSGIYSTQSANSIWSIGGGSGTTPFRNGGSGGGGTWHWGQTGGLGTPGQGFNGGNAPGTETALTGGGGGGAGGVGGNGTGNKTGDAGIGLYSTFTGSNVGYCGGGLGAVGDFNPPLGQAQPLYGGGGSGTPAPANRGGGGYGGNQGGSGIIVIRYPTTVANAITMSGCEYTETGGNRVLIFKGSGSFTIGDSR